MRSLVRGPVRRWTALAEATPAHRDRYVDLLRALAIVVVVLGHWLVSAVTVDDGRLTGVNLLYVEAWTHPLTWVFQVIPVFFLVGGYANTASLAAHRGSGGTTAGWVRSRAVRLLRPTAVLVAALVVGYAVALAAGTDPAVARTAVWFAAISLWFLVVYLGVVALAPLAIAWQDRWGVGVPVALVVAVAAGDVARLLTGSAAAASANQVLAWLAVHQVGTAWRHGHLTRSRRPAVALAVGGAAALLLLTVAGPYGVTMVGAAPGEQLDNTAPPTLALLALAATQTGLVLLLRGPADRWLGRRGPWRVVVAVNSVIMTIFLWHTVPVVVAGGALVGTGVFPTPEVGSAQWFALRVPWLLVLGVLLAVLVVAVGRVEAAAPPRGHEPAPVAVVVGVVMALAGLAGVGLGGPTGVLPAVAGLPVGELVLLGGGLLVLERSGRVGRRGAVGREERTAPPR